jgi:diguanylate cyclase (GGDEF)-like protein
MQTGVNLDFHLEQYYAGQELSFHYFQDFSTLVRICQRFRIDAIVIGGVGLFLREIEMVRSIKDNVFLSIIPVIMYHPDPDEAILIAAYEHTAEEFIHGDWRDRLIDIRIRRVIERSRRDLSINPSTHLPGPATIDYELTRQMKAGIEFAACFADLDHFKEYNDYYGYHRGDKVIKLTAWIIRDTVFDLCREGFVGHIAGDDFIFIIPHEMVDTICRQIIKTFDAIIPYKYDEPDRLRGSITTSSRSGHVEDFPLLSISIPVIVNHSGQFRHIGELSKMLADLKKAAKARPGSTYMIERRSKY